MKKLPIIAVAVLLVLAGCSTSGASYDASPAVVGDNVDEEHNYEVQAVQEFEVNRTVQVSEDRDYRLQLTNWATTYAKQSIAPQVIDENTSGEIPPVGFFALLSTPSVDIAGQELNPIASQSPGEVVRRVLQDNQQVSIEEKVGEQNVTHARTGQELTVEKYDAEFKMNNQTIDGYVLTTVVNTDGGIVIAVGAYPELADGEDEAIIEMMQNVETQDEPPETPSNSTDE